MTWRTTALEDHQDRTQIENSGLGWGEWGNPKPPLEYNSYYLFQIFTGDY